MPTFESVGEYFYSSFSSVSFPNVHEAAYRFWEDISRFGPPGLIWASERITIPIFEVPPPPPPPPEPEPGFFVASARWAGGHPWTTGGIVVGVVGAGLLAGYAVGHVKAAKAKRAKSSATTTERRQVIVVLGGDTPLGLPLVLELEKNGYIVIASVATPEAVDTLEQQSHGYVRALVLDPTEPGTVPIFFRSLAATLSRRFPLNSAGDPHVSPSSLAYIHAVVSLLTLPYNAPIHAPLEHLPLRSTYLPYLESSHIVPLQVIQALLPMLRTTPARSRDEAQNTNGKKTIIVCLPAPDGRVGLPFASAQAMSAAATLRGVEVLRREINTAALTDPSESMKNVKVVVVDVGLVGTATPPPHDVYKAMEDWTASEKLTYGPAFGALAHPPAQTGFWSKWGCGFGVPRRPTPIAAFVNHVLGVVSGGSKNLCCVHVPLHCFGMGLGRLRDWVRGERFSVGAGASTYRFASYLPSLVLDALLNLPWVLISIRNALLPTPPRVDPINPFPQDQPPPVVSTAATEAPPPAAPEHDTEASETGSEAEVESSFGEGSGPGSSWVSLGSRKHKADEPKTDAEVQSN